MHKYINLKTGQYPITETEIRTTHSNVSFPTPFKPPEEYCLVFPCPPPVPSTENQTVVEIAPELTNKGRTDDSIDPDISGFIVNQNTSTNINVSGSSYIFLSIA